MRPLCNFNLYMLIECIFLAEFVYVEFLTGKIVNDVIFRGMFELSPSWLGQISTTKLKDQSKFYFTRDRLTLKRRLPKAAQ